MRSLFDLLAAQRRFIYLVVGLLSVAGIYAATQLPSAIYPELAFPRVLVVAEGSALDARQMVFSVTRPIEEAISIVPGVTRVRSRSIRGGAEIAITFSDKADMIYALQQVQARVNQVRGQLPADLNIDVERMTPSLFPIISYNLEGGDPGALYDIARYQLRPLISRVPGVGRVDVQGSDIREVEVVADPARLASQRLTYDDLANAIRQSTNVAAVGRVAQDYRQYLIVSAMEAHTPEDIGAVVIGKGLRVRDVATVTLGSVDHTVIISGDGKPAALLNITRQPGGNTLAIVDSIASLAASVRPSLPPGAVLKPVYDQGALVRDAMASVRDAMIIGAILAVIILLLFLHHARITAISASSIPLTLAISVFAMYMVGQTFNLMTLGAMAIAIGLVIDDSVVITENIVRHLRINPNRHEAIRQAVHELIWPVTTSTLTTVVVFLPLRLLTGVVGQFFAALSITLTIAVMVSLLLALSIIPLMADQFLTEEDAELERTCARVGRPKARWRAPAGQRVVGRAVACATNAHWSACSTILAACWRPAAFSSSPESWHSASWAPVFSRKWMKALSFSTTSPRVGPLSRRPIARFTSSRRFWRRRPKSWRRRGAPARSWVCSPPSRTGETSLRGSGRRATGRGPFSK